MKDEEPNTEKNGPVVIDAGAWTGGYEPTAEDRATAEQELQHYVMNTRALAQSPLFALKAIVVNAVVVAFLPVAVAIIPLFLFDKIVGAPPWEYMRDHPEQAGWLSYGSLAVLTLSFLLSIYSFRGLLRNDLLPIWRGGFQRKPCLHATDEGFVDTRILRDVVRWENIDDGEGRGIVHNRGRGFSQTFIHLRQPVSTLGHAQSGSTSFIVISEKPFAWSDSPHDFLTAHYEAWRKRREQKRASDTGF